MTDDALATAVRDRCIERLGDRVDEVRVEFNNHGGSIGVGIRTEGWRHAVVSDDVSRVRMNPAVWADLASDELLAAIDGGQPRWLPSPEG